MRLRLEQQQNPVSDDVGALLAVVRPILAGVLYAVKPSVIRKAGGHAAIDLEMLTRLYVPGDGDCGMCFEYAVHDALNQADAVVSERVNDALRGHCHIYGASGPASILFGLEKDGSQQVIDTTADLLTDDSVLMYGKPGRPLKLKQYLNLLAAAFRRPDVRPYLPQSISGLWKADLFVGDSGEDKWVGTSVKINRRHLEAARGLRVGIVPTSEGQRDEIYRDEAKNLIVVPLPHDGSFMQVFYEGWRVVQQVVMAKGRMPKPSALPRPAERQAARELVERAQFPVLEIIDVLKAQAQPGLLQAAERDADVRSTAGIITGAVIAPIARRV